MLAVRDTNGREIEVWHLACLDKPWKLAPLDRAHGLAWHPSGKLLAIGVNNVVQLWGLGDSKPRAVLEGHHSAVVGLTFSPDGELLATTSFDATVRLWDPRSGRQLLSTPGVLGPWFDRSGGRLAYANGTKLVVARVAPPAGVRTLYRRQDTGIADLDVSPDGRLLAAAGHHGVHLWDLPSGKEVAALPIGRTGGAWFHPDGTHLTTGGYSPLRHWPITPGPARLGPPEQIPVPSPGPLLYAAQSADGQTLLAQSGRELIVLDVPARTTRHRLQGQLNLWGPQVSPDGRWIAVGCWHGLEMWAWDGRTGQRVHRLPFQNTSGCRVQFSPNDQWLVAGTGSEYIGLATETWQRTWTIPRANAGDLPGVMSFSRDGLLLAVAHSPVLVKLYRTGTSEEIAALPSPDPHLIGALRFSPDGARLVVGTEGNRLFVWDLRSVRAGLADLGLDWDAPPPRQEVGHVPPERVDVDLGEDHPARHRVATLRRELVAQPNNPRTGNNLAWALATGPDDLRDAKAALPLAEAAVCLAPRYEYLNTLGVVYYRLGLWDEAVEALNRSVEANGDATAFDTFFLAMCHHRRGDGEKARAEYARAVRWMELMKPDDEELVRFRAEAEELLETINDGVPSLKR
jgi:WD40 repeat protein